MDKGLGPTLTVSSTQTALSLCGPIAASCIPSQKIQFAQIKIKWVPSVVSFPNVHHSRCRISRRFSFEPQYALPLNWTVDVPGPPAPVVTIISPSPLQSSVFATILFGENHSAVRRQSTPQIWSPSKSCGLRPSRSPRIVTFVPGNGNQNGNRAQPS